MAVNGFVPSGEQTEHLGQVRERLAQGFERLGERLAHVQRRLQPDTRQALVEQALSSATAKQRVFWLRRASDVVQQATQGLAACHEGCAHCCHLSVVIAEPEARLIARETSARLREPAAEHVFSAAEIMRALDGGQDAVRNQQQRMTKRHTGSPCPFLGHGRCGIYRHRPLMCRLLVNMDDDELLCRLVEGQDVEVPYLNRTAEQLAYVLAMGENARFADIRDWLEPPSPARGQQRDPGAQGED